MLNPRGVSCCSYSSALLGRPQRQVSWIADNHHVHSEQPQQQQCLGGRYQLRQIRPAREDSSSTKELEINTLRRGVSVHCSETTHKVFRFRRIPLTNNQAQKDVCIQHRLDIVPSGIVEQWKESFDKTGATTPSAATISSLAQAPKHPCGSLYEYLENSS